jgi:hypothetical protein
MKVEDVYARMGDAGDWASAPPTAALSPASPELSHKLHVALKKVCCPSLARLCMYGYVDAKCVGLALSLHTLLPPSQAASGKENLFALAKLLEASRHELALVQQVRLISSALTHVVIPVPRGELVGRWKCVVRRASDFDVVSYESRESLSGRPD